MSNSSDEGDHTPSDSAVAAGNSPSFVPAVRRRSGAERVLRRLLRHDRRLLKRATQLLERDDAAQHAVAVDREDGAQARERL